MILYLCIICFLFLIDNVLYSFLWLVQVPCLLQHPVHTHEAWLKITRLEPQLGLEEVWNAGDAAPISFNIWVFVGLDIQEGHGRGGNLVAKLFSGVNVLRYLDNLLDQWFSINVYQADLTSGVPAHEPRLLNYLLWLLHVVSKEGLRNLEVDIAWLGIANDPREVIRVHVQVPSQVRWKQTVELEDIITADAEWWSFQPIIKHDVDFILIIWAFWNQTVEAGCFSMHLE